MKKVLAACIDRVFEFDSKKEADFYLTKMKALNTVFVVVSTVEMKNGKYRLRTKEQYNNNKLLKK